MPLKQELIISRIKELLKQYGGSVKGVIVDNHIILDIHETDIHYWSPQLNFRVEPHEDDPEKSIISGLIGPRPKVWTLFVFIYFSSGIIGFFISSYGVSKWMLNEYSATIWAFPIAVLFMMTAYAAGKHGESLGKDQIEILKDFVRAVIKV